MCSRCPHLVRLLYHHTSKTVKAIYPVDLNMVWWSHRKPSTLSIPETAQRS
jgi:hypothetical protein